MIVYDYSHGCLSKCSVWLCKFKYEFINRRLTIHTVACLESHNPRAGLGMFKTHRHIAIWGNRRRRHNRSPTSFPEILVNVDVARRSLHAFSEFSVRQQEHSPCCVDTGLPPMQATEANGGDDRTFNYQIFALTVCTCTCPGTRR